MGSGWAVYYKNCTTGLVPPIVPQRLTLYRYACLSQAAPPQSCQPLSTRLVINTNILIILTIIITLFGNDLSLTYKALCSDVLCHGLKREQGVKPKVATSWKTRRLTGHFLLIDKLGSKKRRNHHDHHLDYHHRHNEDHPVLTQPLPSDNKVPTEFLIPSTNPELGKKKLNIDFLEFKLNDASLWFLAAMCHSASNLPVTLLSDWSLSQLTQRGRIASNGKPALFLQVSTASSNLHFSQTVQTCGQLKPYRWAERNISGTR